MTADVVSVSLSCIAGMGLLVGVPKRHPTSAHGHQVELVLHDTLLARAALHPRDPPLHWRTLSDCISCRAREIALRLLGGLRGTR